jgi:hypothetical protein
MVKVIWFVAEMASLTLIFVLLVLVVNALNEKIRRLWQDDD